MWGGAWNILERRVRSNQSFLSLLYVFYTHAMELHRIFYYTIPPPPPPPPPLTGETFLRSMSVKGTEFFFVRYSSRGMHSFPGKKILAPPPQFCKFTVPDFARNRNKVIFQTPNSQHIRIFECSKPLQKNFMWNTVTIQYNPLIEEEWDEHFKV